MYLWNFQVKITRFLTSESVVFNIVKEISLSFWDNKKRVARFSIHVPLYASRFSLTFQSNANPGCVKYSTIFYAKIFVLKICKLSIIITKSETCIFLFFRVLGPLLGCQRISRYTLSHEIVNNQIWSFCALFDTKIGLIYFSDNISTI